MIVIWTGWGGIFVVLIPFLLALFADLIGLNLYNDFILGLVLIISGTAIWFLGKHMNKGEEKTLHDVETGEQVQMSTKNRHTLFFIPIQYWGIILGAFALINVVVQ